MQNFTREEYVYLSKLYEKAERFPDMVKSINKYVELDPKLTKEERNLLSAGYKNIISDKRSSWRLLNNLEQKEEEKKNTTQSAYIKEIKEKIEKELNSIVDEIQSMIDKYLLPNAIDVENKVFYLKIISGINANSQVIKNSMMLVPKLKKLIKKLMKFQIKKCL